ncbi:hypothetical protein DPMN_123551 [Dreissena polymorpha]|uniref:Uncharacterized protein n=1 Tax=Dreissena polymorpha TaxID=45954 RepID=A0A9D4GRT7_DREPO|nr:hypothetical protein DPMN_123551 [Dreissena polymorpha]
MSSTSAPAGVPINTEQVEEQVVFHSQIPPLARILQHVPILRLNTDLAPAPAISAPVTSKGDTLRPGVVSNREPGDLREILNREKHLRDREGAVRRDRSRSNHRDHKAVVSEDEADFVLSSTWIFTNSSVATSSRADKSYQQATDENAECPILIKSKSRKQRLKKCSFPECPDAPFRNARRHFRERHFPAHFGNDELHILDLNERRLANLFWIGTKIFGHEVSPDELLRYVNQQRAITADAYVPS